MTSLVVALIVLCASAAPVAADGVIEVSARYSGFEFGFLYGDHYHAEESVVHRHAESMDERDLVVALHLARHSEVDLDVIIEWRRKGVPWQEITHRCELGLDVYYVELQRDPGPPYGRAWGHWKKHPTRKIVLSDDEIRAFTVLRAMSEYTGKPASHIVAERKRGRSHGDIARASKGHKAPSEDTSAAAPGKSKSKGKGKAKKK